MLATDRPSEVIEGKELRLPICWLLPNCWLLREVTVERVQQPEIDHDGNSDGKDNGEAGDLRTPTDENCRETQPCSGCNDGCDDEYLDVSPNQYSRAMPLEDLPRRDEEIEPPHAEGETHSHDSHQHRIECPPLSF